MSTPGALLVVERHARVYRSTWRGSVISTFMNPILYLLAMGLGLGSLVDEGGGTTQLDFDYLTYLAPGLLAAATMMTAAGESMYPVMAGMKWNKYYSDALSTPVSTRDLVVGHFGWLTFRILFTSVVFTGVMVVFGTISIARALLVIPPAVLAGLAFAGPVSAYAAQLEKETGLSAVFRFVITPLFLFSGTFFPIDQLPDWMEPIAYVTPLWHGVEITRAAALGIDPVLHPAIHIAVMLAFL
ncbi:MAG: ABC transporter permease, partial [Acidimicrobiia bacterium]|nr:ABC transporter permease [Acidimicrobiia bacterium]MDX2467094.1 ABC transporter permease [Acidimicrobiia bacterium]